MQTDDLFTLRHDSKPRIASFENPTGAVGAGGSANRRAKGAAWGLIRSGESCVLMDAEGPGIVRHIWMTMNDRDPISLRSLRLDITWDGEAKPAVSAPVGDFFGTGLAHRVAFESVLFKDPEGRSFNCVAPMPFHRRAKVVLTNDSGVDVQLFYSIAYTLEANLPPEAGYFHAFWNRDPHPPLGEDFDVLPRVHGRGRFLGATIGVIVDPKLIGTWFGEGEVKMYLDGDNDLPTWVGTGAEDYVCTAYGQGTFSQLENGCTLADEKLGRWAFYRLHLSDPIFFTQDCRVSIQGMGGIYRDDLRRVRAGGAEVLPVTIDGPDGFVKLLEAADSPDLDSDDFPDGWVNFYRRDDYSSVAYFYLDRPTNELPELPGLPIRTHNMAYAAIKDS